jgi:hypothetical protein
VAEMVRNNWKGIRASHTDEEFGNIFYAQINEVSPHVLSLFVRPKRLQYNTFVEFMQMLVDFASGPEAFYDQVGPRPSKRSAPALQGLRFSRTLCSVKGFARSPRPPPPPEAIREEARSCAPGSLSPPSPRWPLAIRHIKHGFACFVFYTGERVLHGLACLTRARVFRTPASRFARPTVPAARASFLPSQANRRRRCLMSCSVAVRWMGVSEAGWRRRPRRAGDDPRQV